MTRYRVQRTTRQVHEERQPAGLVLGHRVFVAKVGADQAHRGTVTALDPDVTIQLDRAKWSAAFRAGDHVRAAHTDRHAVEATVVTAAHGVLRLRLLLSEGSTCTRCGSDLRVWTMSRFNTDVLCMPCVEDEQLAPGYATAAAVEVAHVRDGDINLRGVGLSEADAEFLAERRQQRRRA